MSSFARRRAYLAIMLTAVLVALAVVTPSASALNPAGAPAPKSGVTIYNGAAANYMGEYQALEDGQTCFVYLDVGRTGTPANPTTTVYMDIGVWDPTLDPCENGKEPCQPCEGEGCPPPPELGGCRYLTTYGGVQIPSGEFVTGPKSFSLNTKVTVYEVVCWWDEQTGEGGCDPTNPQQVPVSLTWQKTSDWEETHSGTYARRGDGITVRESGTWSGFSASISGTVLGGPVGVGFDKGGPAMQTFHQTSRCIAPEDTYLCTPGGGK